MELILLLLLGNHNNLILKLHQKSYLDEGQLFIDSFKVRSTTGMRNKKCFPSLYVRQHNQLKNGLSKKIWKNYYSIHLKEKVSVDTLMRLSNC